VLFGERENVLIAGKEVTLNHDECLGERRKVDERQTEKLIFSFFLVWEQTHHHHIMSCAWEFIELEVPC
jgi:hypothetical protein